MPSHGEYLADGLYRCENDDCPNLRKSEDDDGNVFLDRPMFTGGGFVIDPDTNEQTFEEGVCSGCGQPGVKIDPETLEEE